MAARSDHVARVADPHLLISGLGIVPAINGVSQSRFCLQTLDGCAFVSRFWWRVGEWPTTALLLPPTSTRDSGCDEGLGPRQ